MPALPEEIRTERLLLHKHRLDEAEAQFKVLDAERARIAEWVPSAARTITSTDGVRHVETLLESWASGLGFDYTMKTHDGAFIGRIGMFRIDKSVPSGEIGYWVRESAEGKGLVTEAAMAIETAAWKAGFERLEIRVDPNNQRSSRVPERMGFRLEGVLENFIRINGKLRDTMVWAKLRSARHK